MTRFALPLLLAALVAAGCGSSETNALSDMSPEQQKKAAMGGPIPADVQAAIGKSSAEAAQRARESQGKN